MVEVNPMPEAPAEGEVLIVTIGGAFLVNGTLHDVMKRLSTEEWPPFELADGGDSIVVRSMHVVALRAGARSRRGTIGFHR